MKLKISGFPPAVSPARRNPIISRRELLALTGSITASYFLGGCGGGGDSTVSSETGVSRTAVTGTLTNQINQFSLTSEQIGNIWEGQSSGLRELATFAAGGNRSSRAPGDTRVMFQAVWYSQQGLRSGYERLANGILSEDDQGHVADTVSSNNNLTGDTGVSNPQWLAAMMLQTYSALRVTGALMNIIQIAGIKQMQDWAAGQTGGAEKLITYGIFADTFNSWLDTIEKGVGTPSLAGMKLDVSANVTPASVDQILAGIPALLDIIPYGAGYRAGGSANGIPDDAMLTGSAASNFGLSFLGTLAKITLTTGAFPANFPQTVDPATAKYDIAARLGTTGIGSQITTLSQSAAMAQSKTDALVAQLMSTVLPGADRSAATCLVQMATGGYGVIVAVAQAILSDHSLLGDAISGAMALSFLNTEISTIQTCGTDTQLKILASVACDIAFLRGSGLIGGNEVSLRSVPVSNLPAAMEYETDQIRASTLLADQLLKCTTQLCYPLANAGWNGAAKADTIDLFRQIIAGLTAASSASRTFNNVEVAAAGLIYDLLKRHGDALKPDVLTSGVFIFCVSPFARLLRRSPGVKFAKLPSITSAALLCSAPNFTPARSGAPVDLSTIASLGPLTAITSLVPGVPIHVQ